MTQESQHTEWKERRRDEHLKWICAFANTEGGTLHIGRDDKGHVVGLDKPKKRLEDLPNKTRDPLGTLKTLLAEHPSISYNPALPMPSFAVAKLKPGVVAFNESSLPVNRRALSNLWSVIRVMICGLSFLMRNRTSRPFPTPTTRMKSWMKGWMKRWVKRWVKN